MNSSEQSGSRRIFSTRNRMKIAAVCSMTLLFIATGYIAFAGEGSSTEAKAMPEVYQSLTDEKHYTLGSSSDNVIHIQGSPDTTRQHGPFMEWIYGGSTVCFYSERVIGWKNTDGNLIVSLEPGPRITDSEGILVGSNMDDVIRLQGTPVSIRNWRTGTYEWLYGNSVIRISVWDGRVADWIDQDGNLRVSRKIALKVNEAFSNLLKPCIPLLLFSLILSVVSLCLFLIHKKRIILLLSILTVKPVIVTPIWVYLLHITCGIREANFWIPGNVIGLDYSTSMPGIYTVTIVPALLYTTAAFIIFRKTFFPHRPVFITAAVLDVIRFSSAFFSFLILKPASAGYILFLVTMPVTFFFSIYTLASSCKISHE